MPKHIAVYMRVSSKSQKTASQEPDLERWAEAQDEPVRWYTDTWTGKTMDRPGWTELEEQIRFRQVSTVVVWRLDRLGRTASGLTSLFDQLAEKKVNLVSLKDGLDLSTPAGRLMANVLASVAQFETEVRAERIRAGRERARAEGRSLGGPPKGVRTKVTKVVQDTIRQMYGAGERISHIALAFGLSRPTVYDVLRNDSMKPAKKV